MENEQSLGRLLKREHLDELETSLRENREVRRLVSEATRMALGDMAEAVKIKDLAQQFKAKIIALDGAIDAEDLVEAALRNKMGRVFCIGFAYAEYLAEEARKKAEAAQAAMRG